MKEIHPRRIDDIEIAVPGSNSLTHRLLIAAALTDGTCTIENALSSEDTRLTMQALSKLVIAIEQAGEKVVVCGRRGVLGPFPDPIFLGNSGTSMRLLTAGAALGRGPSRLTGSSRMEERPVQDLFASLTQTGIVDRSLTGNGCHPFEMNGGSVTGGSVTVDCTTSRQYLSALLLM